MVAINEVQAQLVALSREFNFVGINEVRKLARMLEPDEKILQCIKGWHKNRSALLCATDKKIVCIDVRSVRHILTQVDYSDITSIARQQKPFAQSIFIHTSLGIVQFMMWRKRHADQLHLALNRHIQYLKNSHPSAIRIIAKKDRHPRPAHTWRSLVKRVGATSMVG